MKTTNILITIVVIACSFSNTQVVFAESSTKKELVIWKQDYFKNIKIKSRISFYNSTEIKIQNSFLDQLVFVEKGVVVSVDSINNILKTVPRFTPGVLSKMQKNSSGEITSMTIKFSKKDITYTIVFDRVEDGVFVLNPKVTLLYKRKKLEALAVTKEKDCLLLFYLEKREFVKEVNESAEGFIVK